MGKISIARVLLGGIVAGIVGNVLGYLVDGLMLAPRWAAAMKTLDRPEFSGNQFVAFNLIGLLYGILVVGLYALMRPHFGAGPKTAVYAGLGAWANGHITALRLAHGCSRPLPTKSDPYDDSRCDRLNR
jgi:hypothetical protein